MSAIATLLVLGCSDKERELPQLVEHYCDMLVIELRRASESYEKLAGCTGERANIYLPYGSSFEEKAPVTIALGLRLDFCLDAREGAEVMVQRDRGGIAIQRFRERDDPKEMARAVAELLRVAESAALLPLKD